MNYINYFLLFAILGLTACNRSEPAPAEQQAAPPKVIQEAEQVEAILKEKAASDEKIIENASQ